ncbi:MAG: hypothetical protein HeimC3_19180 [Candidatus Heimdallarchaeota archaeon LC_3]|nr:MAG: hypothetical protein HeimC3_19180 [Candidatus Heimdallarchaeota archaeon LC_3]
MAVITKKEIRISNQIESVQKLSKKISLKLSGLFGLTKKLFTGFFSLILSQKREPTSRISKKTYLKYQNSVKSNTNNSLKLLY